MASQVIEKRKYKRHDFFTSIEYSLFLEKTDRLSMGCIMNTGGPGACMYLYRPIIEGQKIEIKRSIFPSLCGTVTVRWVKKIKEDIYVAGLRYDQLY